MSFLGQTSSLSIKPIVLGQSVIEEALEANVVMEHVAIWVSFCSVLQSFPVPAEWHEGVGGGCFVRVTGPGKGVKCVQVEVVIVDLEVVAPTTAFPRIISAYSRACVFAEAFGYVESVSSVRGRSFVTFCER